MPLADVQHQPSAVLTLQGALASRHVPHAWLFFGPDGVGKELAATGLAQALTCPKAPFVGCGTCSSCVRVARGNHPDVTWLMPEDELVRRGLMGKSDFSSAPSRDIRIEQVRRLQARLALRPLEATHKLALIVSAHAMNPPTQNALLKTLEEPPREGAEQVAAMAGGSLARALELDAAAVVEQSELITRFEALERGDARGWLMLAESMGQERRSAEVALEVLQGWLHDVAVAQVGGAGLVNLELKALAAQAATKVTPAGVLRRLVLVEEAKNAIAQRNGSARLQLERMFIEMFST